jgi:hypothetical protein
MARKKDSNGDEFKSAEFISEVTKVRNLYATNRRIRSQEKRDKAETMAFVIAHKAFTSERAEIQRDERRATREYYKQQRLAKFREIELIRSRAKRG